jgi:hypothetical protein
VNFLIDTGASADIILHIQDARRLSIPLDRLRDRVAARGIGGSRDYFEEQGILVFDESDGTGRRASVSARRPVLEQFKMTNAPCQAQLELEECDSVG